MADLPGCGVGLINSKKVWKRLFILSSKLFLCEMCLWFTAGGLCRVELERGLS